MYKIFVQNDRGTDKHALVHVMNGYGEWNIEQLVIPWGEIVPYILLTIRILAQPNSSKFLLDTNCFLP